jgi:hypothetical protein
MPPNLWWASLGAWPTTEEPGPPQFSRSHPAVTYAHGVRDLASGPLMAGRRCLALAVAVCGRRPAVPAARKRSGAWRTALWPLRASSSGGRRRLSATATAASWLARYCLPTCSTERDRVLGRPRACCAYRFSDGTFRARSQQVIFESGFSPPTLRENTYGGYVRVCPWQLQRRRAPCAATPPPSSSS